MVPAGNLTYFYSNSDDIFFIANDCKKLNNGLPDKIIEEVKCYDGLKDVFLEKLNVDNVAKNFSLF